jgi:hypothetical protein
MLRVRCEQPVCCLLSIRPTHVQFSQVWHVKQCNMLATCQTLLTNLGTETQIPYKINKPKLYSCSLLMCRVSLGLRTFAPRCDGTDLPLANRFTPLSLSYRSCPTKTWNGYSRVTSIWQLERVTWAKFPYWLGRWNSRLAFFRQAQEGSVLAPCVGWLCLLAREKSPGHVCIFVCLTWGQPVIRGFALWITHFMIVCIFVML